MEKLGKEYGGWKLVHALPGTLGDLNSAFFIFDGREVFDVQASGIFQRWFINGSRSEQMKINFPITAITLSHDRTTFAYSCKIKAKTTQIPVEGGWKETGISNTERWCVWIGNVKTGKVLHSINPVSTKKEPVTTLAFSLDKKRLFIGGSGAEVWELPVITTGHSVMPDGTKSETKTYRQGNLRPMLRLSEDVGTVLAAAFSPDGKDVLFGNDKSLLYRYDSDENIEREIPLKLADMVSCMKYGVDFQRLYLANETERIHVFSWDGETGPAHREEDDLIHPRRTTRILTIALSPDNEHLLFGGPDTFGIWNLTTRKIETTFPISTDENIIALEYTPDGKTFLAREKENGKIQLWKNDSATHAAVPILKIPEQMPLPAFDSVKSSKKLPDVWSPPPFRPSK